MRGFHAVDKLKEQSESFSHSRDVTSGGGSRKEASGINCCKHRNSWASSKLWWSWSPKSWKVSSLNFFSLTNQSDVGMFCKIYIYECRYDDMWDGRLVLISRSQASDLVYSPTYKMIYNLTILTIHFSSHWSWKNVVILFIRRTQM